MADLKFSDYKELWNGKFKNISFEIIRWQNYKKSLFRWNFYLYLNIDKIPKGFEPESFWLEDDNAHYDHEILSNIDFHGGITFYSKEQISYYNEKVKIVKVGCDYQHLYDDGRDYSLEDIKNDVKRAIDSFIEMIPEYK